MSKVRRSCPAYRSGGLLNAGTRTLMAEIGQPEREIDVRPVESPVPRELPLDPPAPAPREPAPSEPVPA